VYPIHGTLDVAYCEDCAKDHDPAVIFESAIPRCECGGIIRPDVVLYGEGLPNDPWTKANDAIAHGDLLIVVGSSLTVYPAASLVRFAPPSAQKYIINPGLAFDPYDTHLSDNFEHIKEKATVGMTMLVERLMGSDALNKL
jgi:NAD-dependent SIR2 family protein deacetylase